MWLIEEYGILFKFNYFLQILYNIQCVKYWFCEVMNNFGYLGIYNYFYCMKSLYFFFVFDEVFKNDVYIEIFLVFDIDIVKNLLDFGKFKEGSYVICNGYKLEKYIWNIVEIIDQGKLNVILIVDNMIEIYEIFMVFKSDNIKIGICIVLEEEFKFEFYILWFGICYWEIVFFYKVFIQDNLWVEIKMLYFFINIGINDMLYYWNELMKCFCIYLELKKVCLILDLFNIGGGFLIKKLLYFDYDYLYMVCEILMQIKCVCFDNDIFELNIFMEFGLFIVGESGGVIFKVLGQKQQNDCEKWNMIDLFFMINLFDIWVINQ